MSYSARTCRALLPSRAACQLCFPSSHCSTTCCSEGMAMRPESMQHENWKLDQAVVASDLCCL